LIAALVLVACGVLRFIAGSWVNLNTVLVGVSILAAVASVYLDRRVYWEFLTMRTTKHGMNMGLGILLMLVFLVCVNYLAFRHGKSWDFTQEKLNSLSDQTLTLLKSNQDEILVTVFTRGKDEQQNKQVLRQNLSLYQEASSRIRSEFVNSFVDTERAIRYLGQLPDRDQEEIFVFVEKGGKRIRVDRPFDEAAITTGLIKLTRSSDAKIYFLKGHGERDIESDNAQGVRQLMDLLRDSSYKVEALNLLDKKEIPQDAAVLAILGPSQPYLDFELALLRGYLANGGRVLLALDPGQRQNLANLTKTLGIEYANNYVITVAPIQKNSPALIAVRDFDVQHPVTKNFPAGSSSAFLYLASEVKIAPGKPESIQAVDLIKSDGTTLTLNDLSKRDITNPQTKAVVLGVSSKGRLEGAPEGKMFEVVVFGDSDFLGNALLYNGLNRDLVMNAFALLANQTDLISVRPKMPKGTVVFLTNTTSWMMVLFSIGLPLLLLGMSGTMWYRRRGA